MMKMKWFTFILAGKKGLRSNGFIWFRPRCSRGSNGLFKHKPNTKFWCSYWLNFGSSFIFFVLQDSVSVQWFEKIFFFLTLFMCKPWSVAGRTEHQQQWVSNIYSQSERIVQGSVKNTNTARILFWWVTWQQLVLPSNWNCKKKFSSVSAFFFLISVFFWLASLVGRMVAFQHGLQITTQRPRTSHQVARCMLVLFLLSHWHHKSPYCCALWKQCEQCAFHVVRTIHPSKRVRSTSR